MVEIPVEWAQQACGKRAISVPSATVGECVQRLLAEYPQLLGRLAPGRHELFVNGENARFSGGLAAPVSDSDTLLILPARS